MTEETEVLLHLSVAIVKGAAMSRFVATFGAILGLVFLLSPSIVAAQRPAPIQAMHTIELTDPAGDVDPIRLHTGSSHPGFAVIQMAIRSDGKQITFSATLKDPPGLVANDVLQVYTDTDNNASTGVSLRVARIGGFEYRASLQACVQYADRSAACAGVPGGAATSLAGPGMRPTAHFAIASLAGSRGPASLTRRPSSA